MKAIVVTAIILAVAATAGSKLYFLRGSGGGDVLWSEKEAYFFIKVVREGYVISFLRYPWVYVKAHLGAVELPDDERWSLVVLRVTSSGVERHVIKLQDNTNGNPGSNPGQFTPLQGRIYAHCPELDGLCRWEGDHFDPATEEERRRLDGMSRLSKGDIDKGKDGWARRAFGAGPVDLKLMIDLDDNLQIMVNNAALPGTENGTLSLSLLQSGKPPDRIGYFEARVGRVSRTEYEHAFHDPE